MHLLSPETLIKAYALGVFPMAQSRDDDTLVFIDPDIRGALPLCAAHVPRRLARTIRQGRHRVTINRGFAEVIDACRAPAQGREDTWINPQIRQLYCALHKLGFAHSIEVWGGGSEAKPSASRNKLIGGLYGVALAGAFFGESMFSRQKDASKIALVHLMARLKAGGFTILDAQFSSPHLAQFGFCEMPRAEFKSALENALATDAKFPVEDDKDNKMLNAFLQA